MKEIIFLLLLLFLFSCKNKGINEQHIVINSKIIEDTKKDSVIIESVEYIPLYTDSENLIGEINRIIYKNEKFYIFDFMINQSVMVFDIEGKFLYKINNIGRGPGQYTSISDFDIDSEGNILVFDAGGTRNIIKYINKEKKFEIIKPKMSFLEFKLINDHQIVAYLPFSETGIKDCFAIIDLQKSSYTTLIEKRINIDDNQNFFEISHIFKSKNTIYISPRFTNQIFQIQGDKAIKLLEFSEDLLPPSNFIEDMLNNRRLFFENDTYISSISGIYETQSTVLISFQMGKNINLLYNKLTRNTYLLDNIRNCMFWESTNIYGSTGEMFISVITGIDTKKVNESCLTSDKKQELLNLNLNSNPVIVLFNVKEF